MAIHSALSLSSASHPNLYTAPSTTFRKLIRSFETLFFYVPTLDDLNYKHYEKTTRHILLHFYTIPTHFYTHTHTHTHTHLPTPHTHTYPHHSHIHMSD